MIMAIYYNFQQRKIIQFTNDVICNKLNVFFHSVERTITS